MRKPSNCWNICKVESRQQYLRKEARNETLEWIFYELVREAWARRRVRERFGHGVFSGDVCSSFERGGGRACVATSGRGGGAEARRGSGTDSGDVQRGGAGECRATACRAGAGYHGYAGRAQRFDEKYYSTHSGVAGAGGRVCCADSRASSFGGILYFACDGYCGHGSGHARGCSIAGDYDRRIRAADRRSISQENQQRCDGVFAQL